jgi:hypothetical protein
LTDAEIKARKAGVAKKAEAPPMAGINDEDEFPALGAAPARKTPRGTGMQPVPSARTAVRSSEPDIVEAPEARVIFISGLHRNIDNATVMKFFSDYHPIGIERVRHPAPGNWSVSGFVLMATVQDRNRAVKDKNGKTIGGHDKKVVLQNMDQIPSGKFNLHDDAPRQSQARLCLTSWCLISTPDVLRSC